jgi:hypothetical protein
MARLQEQAAQTVISDVLPTDRLQRCAAHLRETAHLIERAKPQDAIVVAQTAPQKIKLLEFLRRQGLAQ